MRDFWGHDALLDAGSHKSWRPLCTASFRLNYLLAGGASPFWFHLNDRLIFAAVVVLAYPVAFLSVNPPEFWRDDSISSEARTVNINAGAESIAFVGALLFAAHPIHVEVRSERLEEGKGD